MELSRHLRRMRALCAIIALANVFFLAVLAEHTEAHTPVTSKYDYNRDVFPLLREHCAGCHFEGGPAPMSLTTYKSAAPWAESIREELTKGRMPPWPVDPASPPVKGGHPIRSRDIDVIVVWAAGGVPEGNSDAKLPEVTFKPQWKLGAPDLKIRMDGEHTVPASLDEEYYECSLATNFSDTKWIKAADLMPETPSIVRDAIISVENGPVLALWQPGGDATTAPQGAAFRLPPGSKIHLQLHYKKHFDQQGTISDRSTIGFYFTDPPPSGRELQSFAVVPAKITAPGGPSTFTSTLPSAARIVALRPMLDRGYQLVNIEAITPSGAVVPLLRLRDPRPQWLQRYWLTEPIELAAGSKITVQVVPLSDYSDEPKVTRQAPLEVVLDYVAL
jgi:hypothetical protein